MSKKAIIFHGTDANPGKYWYPWLAAQLESRGYRVEVPSYPAINREPIAEFLPKVLANHAYDEHSVLIGHSAGAPLVLSILENVNVTISQAILVAGYSRQLPGDQTDPVLQESYNWNKIKQHVKDIIFINSTDDPWGCDDQQGRVMFDHLGGTQIIRREGHFGSDSFHQPHKTFELLDRLIG